MSLAALCAGASAQLQTAPPVWENPAVFRVNKEEPHATKMPFPDAASALAKPRDASPWHRSLNGEWRFHWVSTPDQRPAGFEKPGFDDSAWTTLTVPSNVELHGHGTPIYTNITYPFHKDAPRVMGEPPADWTTYRERNPVSSYRRTFTVPANWTGRQTFIAFNGVASAFHVYLNGHHVGYSQDSRTPAEFNLTAHLKPGENLLAVEVYRYSDGAYLEDQDFWRLSGIFRDVSLWSAANLDIRDFQIDATLADDYRSGVLKLATWVRDYAGRERPYAVEATLLDERGRAVTRRIVSGRTPAGGEHAANFRIDGLAIQLWSAELPRLYSLLLTLKDERGRAVAHYASKIGFRRAEVKNGNLLVNGKAILIKGVNRHDHNHLTGQYVTEASMRADLDGMKRLNINAIRTSHYPNDPRFLELVDEYGFYVVSEANIETHGYGIDPGNALANDPAWYPAQLDRVRNMVELLKNHPSVIIWSLGNESGDGPNFERMGKWVKQRDPSRPLHYEGAWERPYIDFISPMYLNVGNLAAWPRKEEKKPLAEQRPLIMSEYNHTMGNSSGGLDEYWRVIRKERLLQGGFIWDWRDQGILREKPTGHPLAAAQAAVSALDPQRFVTPQGRLRYFAYGGDYGDKPNDNNFNFNGIVGADLVPNPHAVEVAHQYRNLLVTAVDVTAARPRVAVLNENFFLTLDRQPYRWTLLEDGRPLHTGQGRLPRLAPQASAEIQLDLPDVPRRSGAEYHLNLEFLQGVDRPWARADHVVAHEQLALAWAVPAAPAPAPAAALIPDAVAQNIHAGRTTVNGAGYAAVLDDRTGQLVSYTVAGRELLAGPLHLNLWRPPTDNDRGNDMVSACAPWREAGPRAAVTARSSQREGGDHVLRYELAVPVGQTTATLAYRFVSDGRVRVTLELRPAGDKLPRIPRVGLSAALVKELRQWTWFGRGPEENYRDRHEGYPLGVWSGDVTRLWFPYGEPQETANRTGVRWASFLDTAGRGLRVRSADAQTLEVGAYPFAQSDLENRRHPADIPLRDFVTVHIAHTQMGVGGENSWGAWPSWAHVLHADRSYSYAFEIAPVSP
ncbi:glycoside hydrolase family 2 TIM barrel-domain containing protein [Pelomonas sp. Root1217]|uniref:glycoside hydrolase family 2 TIM barrel-domain containing protein n=1 Tax=Pelomonas sp. Root1217 TaxID=1736430 RepID=UPI00138F4DB0|nr:glycoside hydrolase family 2 TIM barrel-domain containing protein [Pelomonas sp. Root1217]